MDKAQREALAAYACTESAFVELQTPFTRKEAVKMLLLAPLAPLRLLLVVIIMTLMACVSFLVTLGAPLTEPLSPARRTVLLALNRPLCAALLLVAGFWVRVRGWEHYREGVKCGALGIFNHVSYMDAVILYGLLIPGSVSRASNAKMPLVGPIIRANQNLYLPDSRLLRSASSTSSMGSSPKSQISGQSDDSAFNEEKDNGARKPPQTMTEAIAARVADRRYPMLVMAPEGTNANGRSIIKFRTGAFVPGAPVLPMILSYGNNNHNPAWTIIDERFHVLRTLCQWVNPVTVTFLPVYRPSVDERADPTLYSSNVRTYMAKGSGLPLREDSHFEYRCLHEAGVRVAWDGSRLVAPEGLLDADGVADLTPAAERVLAKQAARRAA